MTTAEEIPIRIARESSIAPDYDDHDDDKNDYDDDNDESNDNNDYHDCPH